MDIESLLSILGSSILQIGPLLDYLDPVDIEAKSSNVAEKVHELDRVNIVSISTANNEGENENRHDSETNNRRVNIGCSNET